MFQNSYFNKVELRCIYHNSSVTQICTDYKCMQNPFLCQQCLISYSYKQKHNGHQQNIKPISKAIEDMSSQINRCKKPVENIYKSLISDKDSQNLLRWQQDKTQHFISIHNHIKSIKHLIQQQMENICKKFKDALYQEKKNLDKQLEKYQQHYKSKLEDFAKFTQPIALMSTTYKYCANRSNIVLKLASQSNDREVIKWLNKMKRTVRLSQKVAIDPQGYLQEVRKLSRATNELMDDLPRTRDTQYQQQLPKQLLSYASDILRTYVKLREVTNMHRTYSVQQQANTWRTLR